MSIDVKEIQTFEHDVLVIGAGGAGLRAAIECSAHGIPVRECPTRGQESSQMGNRLYVGNLSFTTTQAAIEAAFASAGEVREVTMPTDRETGQPRGFAFVTMGNDKAAAEAISQLNGLLLDGRQLKVNEAQERPPRGGGGGYGGGRGNR